MLSKICTECDTEKSLEDFRNDSRGKHGKEAKCKTCRRAYSRKHYAKNKEYYNSYYKKWYKS